MSPFLARHVVPDALSPIGRTRPTEIDIAAVPGSAEGVDLHLGRPSFHLDRRQGHQGAPPARPHHALDLCLGALAGASWWALAQDERRAIFEDRSRHISVGLEYLPAVARRLHHCRDLGEPFDFLTWFEYAPEDAGAFEELVRRLRQTEEWRYVDREIDIRLTRA